MSYGEGGDHEDLGSKWLNGVIDEVRGARQALRLRTRIKGRIISMIRRWLERVTVSQELKSLRTAGEWPGELAVAATWRDSGWNWQEAWVLKVYRSGESMVWKWHWRAQRTASTSGPSCRRPKESVTEGTKGEVVSSQESPIRVTARGDWRYRGFCGLQMWVPERNLQGSWLLERGKIGSDYSRINRALGDECWSGEACWRLEAAKVNRDGEYDGIIPAGIWGRQKWASCVSALEREGRGLAHSMQSAKSSWLSHSAGHFEEWYRCGSTRGS